jgi:hypothetical protein
VAEKKRKKKKAPARRELQERRFVPEQTHASRLSATVGMLASLSLGGGVYGQWIREEPYPQAAVFVAVGAAGLAYALWTSSSGLFPVRVSDVGIGLEQSGEVSRVRWCDLEKLRIVGSDLVVSAKADKLRIPVGAQPKAVARIVAEADRRVPAVVDIDDAHRKTLVVVKDNDAPHVPLEGVQLAGLRCAASDTLISFERDARLCPTCGEVYHHAHVPAKCVTCDGAVGSAAITV